MPNYCNYSMRVNGRKQDIEEFILVMKSNYDYHNMKFEYDRHMGGRVFEVDCIEIEHDCGDLYHAIIDGYCAWSVYSCMFDGQFTYYREFKESYEESCRSTTVPLESERLNLDIEIFSEESGLCFMEHYIVRHGVIECDDCIDYYEYCISDFETKEEAERELYISITDEEWEFDEFVQRGGIKWEFTI